MVKTQKMYVLALCILAASLAFAGVANAASVETQNVYNFKYGGLRINIIAPVEALPGDNITVTVKMDATGDIHIDYLTVELYGMLNATDKVYLAQIQHLSNSDVTSYVVNYNVSIPDDLSPGLTYGVVTCSWTMDGVALNIQPSGFALTFIKNVALENLQVEYDNLNSTYQSFVQNYTELETTYTELESNLNEEVGSARNLMYVFIVTTVVAAITVFVLLMRKPKRVWV
jgi:hypothetical protein